MIDESSYSEAVADELSLTSSAYAEDVTGEVDLTSAAYGEDVAEAINEQPSEPATLRVCQYNIGHFNMGMESGSSCFIGKSNTTTQAYPQFFDYATQLQRWQTRLAAIGADIYGLPEWNSNFGYNGGSLVSTPNTGLFSGYNLSVGKSAVSGWWINTLASKYAMSNAQDVDLGSLSGASPAYVHEAHVTIGGKDVTIAVTHLNWNQSQTHHDSRVNAEIPALVNRYKDLDYVILLGDFNTQGTYGGAKDASNKTGLEEFQPFINAGFTVANSMSNPLLTCNATGSRPDRPSEPNYPFCYLDNIIVRGFTMSNVTVVDDGNITDHCGLYADLTLIES